jgi:hypothetical protein
MSPSPLILPSPLAANGPRPQAALAIDQHELGAT